MPYLAADVIGYCQPAHQDAIASLVAVARADNLGGMAIERANRLSPRAERDVMEALFRASREWCMGYFEAQHSWTWVDIQFLMLPRERTAVVTGTVAVPAIGRVLRSVVSTLLPSSWRVEWQLDVLRGDGIPYALSEPLVSVYRQPIWHAGKRELSTQLRRAEGHVLRLAQGRDDSSFIIAADGTLGWVDEPLSPGQWCGPPQNRTCSWPYAASSYVGSPYLLGGTSARGIDCSGLVQRLYREVASVVLPRHSTDQLSALRNDGGRRREGQVVRIPTESDSHHLGVLIRRGNNWKVLHASASRGCVVLDDVEVLGASPR